MKEETKLMRVMKPENAKVKKFKKHKCKTNNYTRGGGRNKDTDWNREIKKMERGKKKRKEGGKNWKK